MKKKKITYGVSGMMEYQAVIKVGKNYMKVPFSDGSLSAMGVNPATFTTENFMVQHAIENSSDYKRGRIKTINVIDLDEELRIERNSADPALADKPQEAPAAEAEENGEPAPADKHQEETAAEAEENGEPAPADKHQEETAAEAEATQMEFSCNDDAKDYLEQTYGYVRSKLRNREDIVAAGKAHNINITFA